VGWAKEAGMMESTSAVPNEIETLLVRYLAIQQEEQRLREEKTALQGVLAGYLERTGQSLWLFARIPYGS
jgi:hypothetical protein